METRELSATAGFKKSSKRTEFSKEIVSFLKHYQETVNKLLQLYFKDDKTRVSGDALLLVAELLKVFVREAAARATRQAEAEDLSRVEVEHVEKVLPQLLLDF